MPVGFVVDISWYVKSHIVESFLVHKHLNFGCICIQVERSIMVPPDFTDVVIPVLYHESFIHFFAEQ